MIFHLCKESVTHETEGFPVAHYALREDHPRYVMMHHWHTETEIVSVRRGRFVLSVDGTARTVCEGETALIPSGAVHSGTPYGCEYECIVFDAAILTERLHGAEKQKAKQALRTAAVRPTCRAADDMMRAMANGGSQTETLAAMFALLGEWIKTPLPRSPSSEAKRSRLIPFEQALLFLREHYAEPITLAELAKASGLSEKYFGEYFKNVTGQPPVRYLNEYRVERAAEQLVSEDKTVTEIALGCGFNDLSYFIKSFRKQYGASPSSYRKKFKTGTARKEISHEDRNL